MNPRKRTKSSQAANLQTTSLHSNHGQKKSRLATSQTITPNREHKLIGASSKPKSTNVPSNEQTRSNMVFDQFQQFVDDSFYGIEAKQSSNIADSISFNGQFDTSYMQPNVFQYHESSGVGLEPQPEPQANGVNHLLQPSNIIPSQASYWQQPNLSDYDFETSQQSADTLNYGNFQMHNHHQTILSEYGHGSLCHAYQQDLVSPETFANAQFYPGAESTNVPTCLPSLTFDHSSPEEDLDPLEYTPRMPNLCGGGEQKMMLADEELVGVGLYDSTEPTTRFPMDVFTQKAGKGLQLEETWQPPANMIHRNHCRGSLSTTQPNYEDEEDEDDDDQGSDDIMDEAHVASRATNSNFDAEGDYEYEYVEVPGSSQHFSIVSDTEPFPEFPTDLDMEAYFHGDFARHSTWWQQIEQPPIAQHYETAWNQSFQHQGNGI